MPEDHATGLACERPQHWEREPNAYLGEDPQGRKYFELGGHVYSHQEGHTLWLCPVATFPQLARMRGVILPDTASN